MQEQRRYKACEPKVECYMYKTILYSHKVIEHIGKGHIIIPFFMM